MNQQQIFFDLLRFSIRADVETADAPPSLGEADWAALYALAKKQALVGVLFRGVRRLPRGVAPSEELLMRWVGVAQRTRQQNERLYGDSAQVWRKFREEGFRGCVLKGQGHALLYPDPYMRTAGDIDIYLAGGRQRVMRYINKVCPHQVMRYHHVDFPVMRTPIEVHFTPSYMFYPPHNRRMQRWFQKMMDLQCSNMVSLPGGCGEMAVPTTAFNVVYVLSHLYRHVFTEGIGLRQLLDYYYVLENAYCCYSNTDCADKSSSNTDGDFLTTNNTNCTNAVGDITDGSPLTANNTKQRSAAEGKAYCTNAVGGITDGSPLTTNNTKHRSAAEGKAYCTNAVGGVTDGEALWRDLKRLGLWKFAGAVMYVLHEVFGLPEEKMIAPMDEKEGRFLLDEIMRGGNFGQHDTRLGSKEGEGKGRRWLRMSLRNLRFARHYPLEALSEPLFRTAFWAWKQFWRT